MGLQSLHVREDFPSLISQTLGNGCSQFNLTPYYHISFPYITCWILKQTIQEIKPHARTHHAVINSNSCHYYNVHFMLFHNITCYTNSLLSRIHVTTTKLLNTRCTLVATSVILWSWEWYNSHTYSNRDKLLRYSCMAQRKPRHATCQIGYPYNTADHSNSLGSFNPHVLRNSLFVIRQTQQDKLHRPKTWLWDHRTPQCE